MDALHPRRLVADFPAVYEFYAAVLPKMAGAQLAAGGPEGPYASWDLRGEGLLAILDAAAFTGLTGVGVSLGEGDRVMLVCRVTDVEESTRLCLAHGATLVAAPADRPQWGPHLRTSHLRDPGGALIELQSY